MARLWIVTALAAILLGPLAARLPAQREDESLDARVRRAIDRGVEYLREQQIDGGERDGAWPDIALFDGGVTSLCTLAMLHAGVPPEDPDMKRALKYLRTLRPEKTYVVALQTLVFCAAEPEKDKLLIRRNANWLVENQLDNGAWNYPVLGPGDNSNSHFALVALDAADRAGVEVPMSTWKLALAYWKDVQAQGGYWGYPQKGSGSGSMTCAGIASIVMAGDRVHPADAGVVNGQIECCKRAAKEDYEAPVNRGLSWLAANFTIRSNPGKWSAMWTLYYLDALQRVGRLTGRRFIGQHDWYREGCEYLVRDQDRLSGFWKAPGMAENEPLVATPLALLFLSKGGRPVLVAKAAVGPEESWNHHRHDVRNLVRHVETQWKRQLGWEVLDLGLAGAENLENTPVLYLAGRTDPLPEAEDARKKLAEKLREYLDGGGFILAEGNCDRADFDAGFRKLVELIFPEPEHSLKPLPPEHPIYHGEQKVAPDLRPPLLGVEVKGRTRLVYLPPPKEFDKLDEPLSCLWELADRRRMREYPEDVAEKVEAGLALGVNILDYATNRKHNGKE